MYDSDHTARAFNLKQDIEMLEQLIASRHDEVRVVIFDPLSAYLGGDQACDVYKDNDVRKTLAPLVALAQKHRVAVIGVMHIRKAA